MTLLRYTLLALLLVPTGAVAQLTFTEVDNPFTVSLTSWGASWVDVDGDLDLDLFVSRSGTAGGNELFINNGGTFSRITRQPFNEDNSIGHTWADYDNDGDLDLLTVGNPSVLYRNDGNVVFTRIEDGVLAPSVSNRGWSGAWGDIDNDGFVDIVIAHPAGFIGAPQENHLFRNEGAGAFARISDGPIVTGFDPYTVPSWSDYDLDGDLDLFIGSGPANGNIAPDNLYENDGTGTFTRITTDPIATDARDGQVMNWIDYDNDSDLDLFVTNYTGINRSELYRNDEGTYVQVTTGSIVQDTGGAGLANTWGDLDNDGDLDVFVTTDAGGVDRLYINNGDDTFTRVTDQPVGSGSTSRSGATLGDYDFDGDLDLAVTTPPPFPSQVRLYRNEAPAANGWLKLNLVGVESNRAAIGAKVRATAMIGGETVTQFREVSAQNTFNGQNALTVHFGLGDAENVDMLEITWPSGMVDTFNDVRRNAFFELMEGGSLLAVADEPSAPTAPTLALDAAYPNPFSTATTLRYSLRESGPVQLAVYDVLGRRVTTLVDGTLPAGTHTATWNGTSEAGRALSAGVYLVRLETGKQTLSRRLVLVR